MNELQIAINVLKSTIKWFLLFVLANNIIWLAIVLGILGADPVASSVSQQLDGRDNLTQEMNNG